MEKTYPFSKQKHAHDIEYCWNHCFNVLCDADDGEIQMSKEEYNKLFDFLYGDLQDLQNAILDSPDYYIAWLTGKQIGLAKEIVAWAHESRVQKCIENNRFDDIQYC